VSEEDKNVEAVEAKDTPMHPVVELFLRRCASNPEEIAEGKWSWVLDNIQQYGSEAEKAAVQPISNKIILDMVHKNFMRELLNPEQLNLFGIGSADTGINPFRITRR
jgi:hypothetical protein